MDSNRINWSWSWLLVAAGLILFADLSVLPDWIPVVVADAPFKTDKPSVLVVEESADHGKLTLDQRAVMDSTHPESVKATVEGKGGHFQVIDKDMPADKLAIAPAWVQEAFKVPRQSLPWIVGADARSGFSAPLTTEADAMAKAGGLK